MTTELNTATEAQIEAAIVQAEVDEILSAEKNELPVTDMAEALAQANGYDAQATAPEDEDAAQAPAAAAAQDEAASFEDLVAAISNDDAQIMTAALSTQLAERAQYETEQNPNNLNIQKTLSKLAKKQVTPGIVRGMMVSGTPAVVINRNESGSKRRNVYALEKMHDLLYAAVTGHMGNAINRAIMATMVRVRDVQLPMTAEVAKGAASDKIPVPTTHKPYMRSHTVSASTAPTQMSSTMTALEDLGVVKNVGSQKAQVFEFTDTPLARRLIEVVRTKILVAAV